MSKHHSIERLTIEVAANPSTVVSRKRDSLLCMRDDDERKRDQKYADG